MPTRNLCIKGQSLGAGNSVIDFPSYDRMVAATQFAHEQLQERSMTRKAAPDVSSNKEDHT
jgi:hypothetical protein